MLTQKEIMNLKWEEYVSFIPFWLTDKYISITEKAAQRDTDLFKCSSFDCERNRLIIKGSMEFTHCQIKHLFTININKNIRVFIRCASRRCILLLTCHFHLYCIIFAHDTVTRVCVPLHHVFSWEVIMEYRDTSNKV